MGRWYRRDDLLRLSIAETYAPILAATRRNEKAMSRDDENALYAELRSIVARLRAPDGCPWDREQTHASLRPYLLQESYEALAALDDGDMARLPEELGDVLFQVLLHSQLGEEASEFSMADV